MMNATEGTNAPAPAGMKPKQPAAPAKPALPKLPEIDWSKPVPVKVVRFDRPVDYPGSQPTERAKTTTPQERTARPEGPTWDVDFLAPVRMFRITYTDKSRNRCEVGFISESRSLGWEPVA
jgi:hypothetical protein